MAMQVRHPLRDWRNLGECHYIIKHSPEGGGYAAVAVNSEGFLVVTDEVNKCVHLLHREGALMRSIGQGVLGGRLCGVAFDVIGNVWVTDCSNSKVHKLSQDGHLLQTIHHAGSERDRLKNPTGVAVSPEGLIYICDQDKHRIKVHDEEGNFLFAFGSNRPRDVAFGSDGLVYVTDPENKRVSVWSNEGTFKRDFQTKYDPFYIAATSDNHLLITSYSSNVVMVYTLEDKPQLVHEFGREGSDTGRFNRPLGICVDDSGVVYVADSGNKRVQVF